MVRAAPAALALTLCAAVPASAQIVLTFDEAIARAREQAGEVAVARAAVAEAEAAVVDASARFRDNPVLEIGGGPRAGSGARYTEIDIGLSQQFETGGQRLARIDAARAAVARGQAEIERAARDAVYEAGLAFLDGIAAGERLRLAEEANTVSADLLRAAERRYAAGDIAAIDLNLARVEAARTSASLAAARADLAAAVGVLRALLRLPDGEPIELSGSLDIEPLPPLERLVAAVESRPEFAALDADLREAEAQERLGRALARPDLGLRVGYEREEGDTIVLGGLTVTLPAFQQGRGTLAAGRARASRARVERETLRTRALAELRSAHAVASQRGSLAAALAAEASPGLADNDALGRRSYEAGEMSLMDLLLIRRDAVETRLLIIDRRLEAARSRLHVLYIAGELR